MDRSSPGLGTILHCGSFPLQTRWSSPAGMEVQNLSPRQFVAEVGNLEHRPQVLILSCCDEGSGGISRSRGGSIEMLRTLGELQKAASRAPIILLTQNGLPLEVCCSAVRLGVSHFVDTDSFGWEVRLSELVKSPALRTGLPAAFDPQALLDTVGIRAISPAMQNLMVQVYRGAQVSDATVLIHGESGTGKQLLAEAIHRLDPKRGKLPFIPVNCAAITGTLAESELFGHLRGAFSGATDTRLGYFRAANHGTIFLDEISELPLYLQPKLLRVLQERRVLPVGSDKEEAIDVRVIAASNVSLQSKIAKGEFRLDLYQRLNVIHLTVPPLRQRTEDIPLLVRHFIEKYQHYCTQPIREVDPRVYELLKRRATTGNVREIENIVRQTLVFKAYGDRVELQDLPRYLLEAPDEAAPQTELIPGPVADNLLGLIRSGRLTLRQVVEQFERALIQQASRGSPQMTKIELARILGLPRRTLYHKLNGDPRELHEPPIG